MAPARLYVGTSGFSYPSWRGVFYPDEVRRPDMLSHYGSVFPTVEVNYTFRRLPTAALLAEWYRKTPPGFRFVLKASQRITHQKRLKNAGDVAAEFLGRAAGLRAKRGPVLFQLPPNAKADVPRLAEFLATLPRRTTPVFEFRHESWFTDETYRVLRRHRASLCIADTDEATTPFVPTGPVGYVRLRRTRYRRAELVAWAERIAAVTRWRRVFVFFMHDETGQATRLARQFMQLSAAV